MIVTAHRRENWGKPLAHIAEGRPHDLRPRIPTSASFCRCTRIPPWERSSARALEDLANVSLVEPMGYAAFARLLKRAYLVLTDSGGIQEEAPSLGTPVLVLRKSTERQEGVDAGTLELVGTAVEAIVAAANRLLTDSEEYASTPGSPQSVRGRPGVRAHPRRDRALLTGSPAPAPFGPPFDRHAVLRAAGARAERADALLRPLSR